MNALAFACWPWQGGDLFSERLACCTTLRDIPRGCRPHRDSYAGMGTRLKRMVVLDRHIVAPIFSSSSWPWKEALPSFHQAGS